MNNGRKTTKAQEYLAPAKLVAAQVDKWPNWKKAGFFPPSPTSTKHQRNQHMPTPLPTDQATPLPTDQATPLPTDQATPLPTQLQDVLKKLARQIVFHDIVRHILQNNTDLPTPLILADEHHLEAEWHLNDQGQIKVGLAFSRNRTSDICVINVRKDKFYQSSHLIDFSHAKILLNGE